MKRLNKFLKIAILGLLSLVAVDGTAQKKVTYTFTGRQGTMFQVLLKPKPIDLKASGAIPLGVSVGKIEGIEYEEGNDENVNDMQVGSVLGIPLLPQYIIKPGTTATVNLDGFRYEIDHIDWNVRTQVPLISSSALTWATQWNNSSTNKNEWTWDDSDPDKYNSSWEFVYHTTRFIKDSHFHGLRTLNIDCTSRLPLHGVSVKDFDIYYYEPEIKFTENNTSIETAGDIDDIKVEIAHLGAFVVDYIEYSSSDESVATISGNGGTTPRITTYADGTTTITAKLIVTVGEGPSAQKLVISKASYKLKVGNRDFEFVNVDSDGDGDVDEEDLYCEYMGTGTNTNSVHRFQQSGTSLGDSYSGLRLWTQQRTGADPNDKDKWYNYDDEYQTSGKVEGQITHISTNTGKVFRSGLQMINYNQFTPKYTKLTVSFDFTARAKKTSDSEVQHGAELIDFGQGSKDDVWPNSGTLRDLKFNTVDDGKSSLTNTIVKASGTGADNEDKKTDVGSFTFNRSGESNGDTMTEWLGAFSYIRMNRVWIITWIEYDKKEDAYFDYSNRKTTYEYYATVSFNANGGTGSMTAQNDHAVGEAGTFKLNSINTSTIKRDGFTFQGWNTAADGSGTAYADADQFCPYDDVNGGGKGPVTLYAQWKQIPVVSDDPTQVDEDAILVYSLWGNGGTIEEDSQQKDAIANIYATGQTVPDPVTVATRPGYNFLGYYTSTTDGQQVFDASGNPVYANGYTAYASDGITLKWTSEEESLELYAHWEEITDPNDLNYVEPHTLTLKYNYTSCPEDKVLQVMKGSGQNNQVTSSNPPARSGYIFTGWYKDETEVTSWEAFRALHGGTTGNYINVNGKRYNQSGTGGGGTPYTNAPHDLKINPANSVLVYNANGESVKLVGYTNTLEGEVPQYEAVNPEYFDVKGIHQKNEDIILYAHWLDTNSKIAFHEGTTSASSAKYKTGNSSLAALISSTLNTGTTGMGDGVRAYEEIEFGEVMLSRGFKESEWNTICFPCYVSEEQVDLLFDKVMIYSKLECDNNSAIMKFRESRAITPGTPYFVKLKSGYSTSYTNASWITKEEGLYVFHFKNAEVNQMKTTISYTDNGSTVAMVGELDTKLHIGEGAVDASTTEYLYLQDDKFYISGGTYNVSGINKTVWGNNKGFRCYFTRPKDSAGDAKAFTLKLDLEGYDGWSGEDAIEDINADGVYSAGGSDIYDLSGRQLMGKPQRGLYIVNGRKYISK